MTSFGLLFKHFTDVSMFFGFEVCLSFCHNMYENDDEWATLSWKSGFLRN